MQILQTGTWVVPGQLCEARRAAFEELIRRRSLTFCSITVLIKINVVGEKLSTNLDYFL